MLISYRLPSEVTWLARLGNGEGQDLSPDQVRMVFKLYQYFSKNYPQKVARYRLDFEICRCFLVASNWSLNDAQSVMTSMIRMRSQDIDCLVPFQNAPVCFGTFLLLLLDVDPLYASVLPCSMSYSKLVWLDDPYASNLRCIGLDKERRPCIYSCFSQCDCRLSERSVIVHLRALLDEVAALLLKLRLRFPSRKASQQQIIWVLDCYGYDPNILLTKTAM